MEFKDYIDVYEGFPNADISFKDINSLIRDPKAYQAAVNRFYELAEPLGADLIVSPESRGYIFGCPLAYKMGLGMVPVRKPGKLPGECISASYTLEYGEETLQIQKNAIKPGQKVIIIDDLMATGGTMDAIIELVQELGGEIVGILTLIELTEFNARDHYKEYFFESLTQYPH